MASISRRLAKHIAKDRSRGCSYDITPQTYTAKVLGAPAGSGEVLSVMPAPWYASSERPPRLKYGRARVACRRGSYKLVLSPCGRFLSV
jgi:hypothetical protein